MTTRLTDEEISILIDEVARYAAMAAYATSGNERASHRNGLEKAKQQLRDACLTERQAARDGVMDEMISVTKTDANNYCEILSLLGMEEEGDPVAWVKSTLTIIHERNAKQAALESIAQPVRLPDAITIDDVVKQRLGKITLGVTDATLFVRTWNGCRDAVLKMQQAPDAHYTDLRGRKWGLEPQPQQSVPDGWKLVPIEPTDAMLDHIAGTRFSRLPPGKQAQEIAAYSRMLSAAPTYNGKKKE